MKSWFLDKAYSKHMINLEMEKVRFSQSNNNINELGTEIPFIMTYHPKLKVAGQLMKVLQHVLYQDELVKKVLTPPPIAFYRIARKIISYLARAKLCPLESKFGCYKCGNQRFLVCENIEETDTFSSAVTGVFFKINHLLGCNGKCLYILTYM